MDDSGFAEARNNATFFGFFWAVFKVVTVTLGGGYAICPVFGSVFTGKGWISEEEFYLIVARAQSIPGPIALNTAMLTGLRLFGLPGLVPAVVGVLLTPLLSIILVGYFLLSTKSIFVARFLQGAGFVVPGIVLAFLYRNAKSRKWTLPRAVSVIALSALFVLFPRLAIPLLIGGILVFFLIEARRKP